METMLKVMQHRGENWSNAEIAARCGVSHTFVNSIRPHLETDSRYDTPRTVTRNGSTYEMNTSNIGKRSSASIAVMDAGPEPTPQERKAIEYAEKQAERLVERLAGSTEIRATRFEKDGPGRYLVRVETSPDSEEVAYVVEVEEVEVED